MMLESKDEVQHVVLETRANSASLHSELDKIRDSQEMLRAKIQTNREEVSSQLRKLHKLLECTLDANVPSEF